MIQLDLTDKGLEIKQTPLKYKEKDMPETKAKKAKKKTVVKKKKVEVLGQDPFVNISAEVNSMTEADSLDNARKLSQDIDCNHFRLGGILSKISDEGWWSKEGYVSFKVFVEAELGMNHRKSLYLVSIYNHIVGAGIPYEKVKDLGWTKLRELAPVLTAENVDEWVKTVDGMNTLQLIEEIKDSKKIDLGADEKVPNTIKSKVFKLHDDQRETIEEAIEKAKISAGTEFDAVALEYICLDYLGTPEEVKVKDKVKVKKTDEVTEEDLDEVLDELDEDDYEEEEEEINF